MKMEVLNDEARLSQAKEGGSNPSQLKLSDLAWNSVSMPEVLKAISIVLQDSNYTVDTTSDCVLDKFLFELAEVSGHPKYELPKP